MNEGCIPTKTLLRSAEVVHLVRQHAHEFGVRNIEPEKISFDLAAAVARKEAIVGEIISGIHSSLKKNRNITYFTGHAEFTSPVDIRIDGRQITAAKTILGVGSRTAAVNISGLTEAGYITNFEALQLEKLPSSMVIIGGGYIGVEFAQMYARFGSKVTLLGRAPHLMKQEDKEVAVALENLLRTEGVEVYTDAPVVRVEKKGKTKTVLAKIDGQERSFEAETILYAAGRVARVEELGLEQAGVELAGPFIKTDRTLHTTAENIWSIGDANGGAMFTHRATYDAPIAALNAVKDLQKETDYRVVPRAVFTEPALASVGLTEKEAREAGYDIKVGKHLFAHTGRAKAIGQTAGMVKIVAETPGDRILGATILGPHADILIHEVAVAMYNYGTITAISKTIHIHPTLSEAVKGAAKALK